MQVNGRVVDFWESLPREDAGIAPYRVDWFKVTVYAGMLAGCLGFWYGVFELARRVL